MDKNELKTYKNNKELNAQQFYCIKKMSLIDNQIILKDYQEYKINIDSDKNETKEISEEKDTTKILEEQKKNKVCKREHKFLGEQKYIKDMKEKKYFIQKDDIKKNIYDIIIKLGLFILFSYPIHFISFLKFFVVLIPIFKIIIYKVKYNSDRVKKEKIKHSFEFIIIKLLKIVKYLIIMYIIIKLDLSIEKNMYSLNDYLHDSSITLTVNKTGKAYIYFHGYCVTSSPIFDEIYINGVQQNEKKSDYYFNETNNNITLIWKTKIRTALCMFHSCSDIVEINLSKFDASSITSMSHMLTKCSSLKYLDLSNLDTSSVKETDYLFYNCSSLKYLNLSSFNTSLVTNMEFMFSYCKSLDYLDLSNLNTTLVNNMRGIFAGSSFKHLDLSKFNTSSVKIMQYMFYDCFSLKYLDLSNNDLSSVTDMRNMFSYSRSLIYINFGNSKLKGNANINGIFDNTNPNLIICNKFIEWNNLLTNFMQTNINCNENSNEYKCYKKENNNEQYNKYICNNICGNNFYHINNTNFITCMELENGYYIDENYIDDYPLRQCYFT